MALDDKDEVFSCTMCGDCCRGYGGTRLHEADLEAMATFLHIDKDRLLARYCIRSGRRVMLAQKPDGYCVMWDGLCTVHPVKPRMCRDWPYLPAVLKDPSTWQAMASCCPGIRADAPADKVARAVRRHLEQDATQRR